MPSCAMVQPVSTAGLCAHLPDTHTCCREAPVQVRGRLSLLLTCRFPRPSLRCPALSVLQGPLQRREADLQPQIQGNTSSRRVSSRRPIGLVCTSVTKHGRMHTPCNTHMPVCTARRCPNPPDAPNGDRQCLSCACRCLLLGTPTCAHAAVCQCLNHEVHVCWAAAAEACDC